MVPYPSVTSLAQVVTGCCTWSYRHGPWFHFRKTLRHSSGFLVMEHQCSSEDGRMFCACGKVVDRQALKRVRFKGFTGGSSTNPKIERFWATGDPEGL